jgi:hypothetical protein
MVDCIRPLGRVVVTGHCVGGFICPRVAREDGGEGRAAMADADRFRVRDRCSVGSSASGRNGITGVSRRVA